MAGCGIRAVSTPISAPPHPMTPRSVNSVAVYTSGPPSVPHVDVTLIQVQRRVGSSVGTDELLAELRQRGAWAGCDALVLNSVLGRTDVDGLVATCIAYTGVAEAASP